MSNVAFLDRDGVLVRDVGVVTGVDQISLLEGVPEATKILVSLGYRLMVVTNQTAMARGLIETAKLDAIHQELNARLLQAGGCAIEAFMVCPHHPHAQVHQFRVECDCRKPQPGLLMRAARDFGADLTQSILFGDRRSDIAAGRRAGCRANYLVSSNTLDRPGIVGSEALRPDEVVPNGSASSLLAAVRTFLMEGA